MSELQGLVLKNYNGYYYVKVEDDIFTCKVKGRMKQNRFSLATGDLVLLEAGKAGEGIGGPHIGYDMPWPMSIMMKCFTATSDDEIRWCMRALLATDAGTGFIHESFHKDDATHYTRPWFAWQNTLFGELVCKLIQDGKAPLLNSL